jgi:hypothetical protein
MQTFPGRVHTLGRSRVVIPADDPQSRGSIDIAHAGVKRVLQMPWLCKKFNAARR